MGCLKMFGVLAVAIGAIGCGEAASEGPAEPEGPGGFTDDAIPEGRHHPLNFAEPSIHGPMAFGQGEPCTECHGDQLDGGTSSISCDTCHPQGWRTDCVYCHGGQGDDTGAPPINLFGDVTRFDVHARHVTETIHSAYDCSQCHRQPLDVLSAGHFLFGDDSPGRAEVNFAGGLSPEGAYAEDGRCSALYCHGDGRGPTGSLDQTRGAMACNGCHPDGEGPSEGWRRMSGEHAEHLFRGATCSMCHREVVSPLQRIKIPALHVDGAVSVELLDGMTLRREGSDISCTGGCHLGDEFEQHNGRTWR